MAEVKAWRREYPREGFAVNRSVRLTKRVGVGGGCNGGTFKRVQR